MNYKSFPPEYWRDLKAIVKQLASEKRPLVAAFDADGTLWDTDLGENFFQYQIDHALVPLPEDPWAHYLGMKKINNDPRDAYAWLAQINAGIPVSQVQTWAQQAFDSIVPPPIFEEQKKVIQLLMEHSVQIFIVTASIRWAVEPGARALGLKDENVIGIETRINDGIVTAEKVLPITYRQGKIDALLKKTGNIAPFFCSGNTAGDFELLSAATHIKLAVSAASRDDKLFRAEDELMTKAKDNNWWRHRFI